MKPLKTLFTLLILALLGFALVVTRPTETDFAKWYVEHNETGMGDFFDNVLEKTVLQRTETSDYVVFSLFELDGEERYVGVAGQIIGKETGEEVTETLTHLVEQAKEVIESNGQ